VAVLFVVAAGMYSTGAITLLADRIIGLPSTVRTAQLKILAPVTVGSAFLNNTPLVAMMIPVIRDISRKTGVAASKLYMPLSFASMLGGAATLIGTSVNLIIAGLVLSRTGEELNIFFPSLVAGPAAVVGILFLMTVGTRLLPSPESLEGAGASRRRYRTDFVVQHGSSLEGKTLTQAGLLKSTGYELVQVRDEEGRVIDLDGSLALRGGHQLEFDAEAEAVPDLWRTIGLMPLLGSLAKDDPRHTHHLVEVVVSERAEAVGRRLGDLPTPQSTFDYFVVGSSKRGQAPGLPFEEIRIEAGDAGIMEVTDSFFFSNRDESSFTIAKRLEGHHVLRTERAVAATLITAGMVLLAAFGVMSMLNAALLAALAMFLTGCISLEEGFGSIEWDTIVVLGAAVGLEAAVTGSGLSAEVAGLLGRLGGGSPLVALTAVFAGAVLMTNVITNAAAAAFMFPIAFSLSDQMGLSARPFVILLMLGCSYAFVNPAGYQTNLMVQKPGRYAFADFVKVGLPLTLIVGAVALVLSFLLYL
jgi:di/tricarboxylate transporter